MRVSAVVRWGLGSAVTLLIGSGCALLPQFGPPPAVGPPYIPSAASSEADTSAVALSPADSAVTAVNKAFQRRVKPGTTVYPDEHPAARSGATSAGLSGGAPHRAGHKGSPLEPDSVAGADTIGTTQSSDSIGPSTPPALSVDLPPSAQEQLEIQARSNCVWADSTAKVEGLRTLAPRDRDKLDTALGLSKQSREAMERGDLQAAANLAYKARLLVEEVAKR